MSAIGGKSLDDEVHRAMGRAYFEYWQRDMRSAVFKDVKILLCRQYAGADTLTDQDVDEIESTYENIVELLVDFTIFDELVEETAALKMRYPNAMSVKENSPGKNALRALYGAEGTIDQLLGVLSFIRHHAQGTVREKCEFLHCYNDQVKSIREEREREISYEDISALAMDAACEKFTHLLVAKTQKAE